MPKHGKTTKALFDRIKITGTGKVLKRRRGQSKMNAKDDRNATRRKRSDKKVPKEIINDVKFLIPNL